MAESHFAEGVFSAFQSPGPPNEDLSSTLVVPVQDAKIYQARQWIIAGFMAQHGYGTTTWASVRQLWAIGRMFIRRSK